MIEGEDNVYNVRIIVYLLSVQSNSLISISCSFVFFV